MKKYDNVDVVAALGAVVELNTKYFKEYFNYNVGQFKDAAKRIDGENNRLLWLSHTSGTECIKERDVYFKESLESEDWIFWMRLYADTQNGIIAYAVEITGMENGKPIGNLYELDCRQHLKKLKRSLLHIASVVHQFKYGTEIRVSYNDYLDLIYGDKQKQEQLLPNVDGEIKLRYEPENEDVLQKLLKRERDKRQKYTPAVFKACVPNEITENYDLEV